MVLVALQEQSKKIPNHILLKKDGFSLPAAARDESLETAEQATASQPKC